MTCIFSDTVTKEIGFSDKAQFISLDADKERWADVILNAMQKRERRNNTALITEMHYNIHHEAKLLQERYLALYDGGQAL